MKELRGSCSARKYQLMEVNTQRRGTGLKEKIPDIQKTLDTVQFLKARKVGSYSPTVLAGVDASDSQTRNRLKQPLS